MIKFGISQTNEYKKYAYLYLLIIFILLVIGCSKNTNKNANEQTITGSVVENSQENCRLSNESDCRPIEIRRGEQENEEADNAQETANVEKNINKTINLSKEIVLSNCTESWKCVETNYRAYQYSNCSWISIEHCIYGCKNDTCNPPPICKPNSLKCNNDLLMKCSKDGSEWQDNESCDYHCENGICIGKNETITNATNLNNATNSTNVVNSTNTTQVNNFISDNCINVLNFNYAPAGNNLSEEYFTLKNSCSYQIDMSGWTAKDNSTHVYTFPSFNLGNAAQVTIITGSGSNNPTTLYWGSGIAIWNNGGDTLYLNTSNGTSVLIYSYP